MKGFIRGSTFFSPMTYLVHSMGPSFSQISFARRRETAEHQGEDQRMKVFLTRRQATQTSDWRWRPGAGHIFASSADQRPGRLNISVISSGSVSVDLIRDISPRYLPSANGFGLEASS